MGEAPPVDNALGRVVVDHHPVDLGQEGVAVAKPPPARPVWRAICAAWAIRFSLSGWVLAHSGVERLRSPWIARFKRGRPRQLRQHGRAAVGVIAGRGHVANAEHVRLIFLVAGEAQQAHLGKLLGALRDQSAERIVANDRAEDRPQHAPDRVAVGCADRRAWCVVGGDVPGFMADDERQLGFVVHDAHQLARDVDIAAGHGEGILDRAVQAS